MDPEVVVLRKLNKLFTFKTGSGDENNTPSKLSYRSHDNIGYMRSPLIERESEA